MRVTCVEEVLEAARQGELVLMMDWQALKSLEPRLPSHPPQDLEGLLKAYQVFASSRPASLLRELCRGRGGIRRILYFSDDGVLARLLGERVLDVYGSRLRLRCTRCGRRWWPNTPNATRCPSCSSRGEPDVLGVGEKPASRLLVEAVYEVSTASAVVAAGVPGETVPVVLAAIAAKTSRLYALKGGKSIHGIPATPLNHSLNGLLVALYGDKHRHTR